MEKPLEKLQKKELIKIVRAGREITEARAKHIDELHDQVGRLEVECRSLKRSADGANARLQKLTQSIEAIAGVRHPDVILENPGLNPDGCNSRDLIAYKAITVDPAVDESHDVRLLRYLHRLACGG
jgi:hypothetical protein